MLVISVRLKHVVSTEWMNMNVDTLFSEHVINDCKITIPDFRFILTGCTVSYYIFHTLSVTHLLAHREQTCLHFYTACSKYKFYF